MSKPTKLHVVSLGCTKNLVDTEVMLGRLIHLEMTDDASEADVLIVNTCGFIDAAKEESVNTILDLHERRREGSVLVVAGCLTERYREELQKELPEVDLFTGVGDYDQIDELLALKSSRFSPQVFLADGQERVITGSSTHAYVKIAEGCNQLCAFCAIPEFKGKLHSRTPESIVKETERLAEQGYFDLSFIAQDTSSFGRDLGQKDGLIPLIEAVDRIKGVRAARIMYLYPSTTSEALIEAIGRSAKFANYFDIPIQHASDRMLKLMKRGAGKEQTLSLIRRMRELPQSWLRTSFIVGHPGETEEDFAEMLELINSGLFDMINLFRYSEEEGTAAEKLEPKVPDEVVAERMAILEGAVEMGLKKRLVAMEGTTIPVVIGGESEEHELLIAAKHLHWGPEIDPEILINESEAGALEPGDVCEAVVLQGLGDRLLGKVTGRLSSR